MSNPALDQTTLEESFFFSEYAKRRFEMSKFNDGQINGAIDNLNYRSSAIFCDDVPKSFDIDLLTDVIYVREALMLGFAYTVSFTELRDYIIFLANSPDAKRLLDITNHFNVSAACLPFPYEMAEIAMLTKSGEDIPITFKTLKKNDRRCVIHSHSDCRYVYFGIDKNLQLDEIIDLIKKNATLFKSRNDYENCERNDIIKEVHKQSNLKTHRQALHNVFNKSMGLLIYDLYIDSDFDLERALERHRKHRSEIKCDPRKTDTSEDCGQCKHFSRCSELWRKQFNIAVGKIKDTDSSEEWLDLIKINQNKRLIRRPTSFFKYAIDRPSPSVILASQKIITDALCKVSSRKL